MSVEVDSRPPLGVEDITDILCLEYPIAEQDVQNIEQLVSYDDKNFKITREVLHSMDDWYAEVTTAHRDFKVLADLKRTRTRSLRANTAVIIAQPQPAGMKTNGNAFFSENSLKDSIVLMKITNYKDSANIAFMTEITDLMYELSKQVPCSRPLKNRQDSFISTYAYTEDGEIRSCVVRLFTFLTGSVLEEKNLTQKQAFQWGALMGKTHKCLSTMNYPSILERDFVWTWRGLTQVKEYTDVITDYDRRLLVETILDKYLNHCLPILHKMSKVILHGDLNERNILMDEQSDIYAVLDFGDCHGGPLIWDVCLVLAYMGLVIPNADVNIIDYYASALSGYAQHMPNVLQNVDVEMIMTLICTRLCQSLTLGLKAYQISQDPYVITTQKHGWDLLEILTATDKEDVRKKWNQNLQQYQITV